MKMKKIAILLLACAALPMQAQTIGAVQHRAEYAEELLQEAKLLHNERSYDMAEHLLEQMLKGKTTRVQEREAVALLARIAYHKNYDEALGAIEAYLKKFPDAPELNRMKALAMMCYYAGLLQIRNTYEIFRSSDSSIITFESLSGGGMVVKYDDGNGNCALVVINPTNAADSYTLSGEWNLVANGTQAGSKVIETMTGKVSVDACSVLIFVN